MTNRKTIADLLPNTQYAIQVRAVGKDNVSNWSQRRVFTTIADTDLPQSPVNVTWVTVGNAFHGEWDAVSLTESGEKSAVTRYEVELVANGITKVDSVPNATGSSKVTYNLSFSQNTALFTTAQPTVTFRVRAVDNKELKSNWSTLKSASNPVPAAPTAPAVGNVATAGIDNVQLAWTASPDDDVTGYNVYVGTSAGFTPSATNKIYSGNATRFTYLTTTYSAQYFKIRAVDVFKQESTDLTANATPNSPGGADSVPPATPTSLTATLTNTPNESGAVANLTWTLTSPPSDLQGFVVQWRKVGDTTWSQVSTDKDARSLSILVPQSYTNYEFQIKARDFSANESAWSATTTANAAANQAPSQPAAPTAVANTMQIQVSHTGNKSTGGSPMESDVIYYEVYASTTNNFTEAAANKIGTMPVGPIISETFPVPANATSGTNQTWYVKVIAVDRGGLKSPVSLQATASVGLISSINIADAAITDAKITTLTANKITAGTGFINDINIKSKFTIGDPGRAPLWNAITNPGFENGLTPHWSAPTIVSYGNSSVPRTGTNAGYMTMQPTSGTLTRMFTANGAPGQPTGHPANAYSLKWSASVWVRNGVVNSTAPTGFSIGLEFWDSSNALISSTLSTPVAVTTTYQQISVTADAPANTSYVTMSLYNNSTVTTAVRFDDMSLVSLTSTVVNGYIDSVDYQPGLTGFRLSSAGLEINKGSIDASALRIQVGQNIVAPQYADFEFQSSYYENSLTTLQGALIRGSNPNSVFNTQSLGTIWGTATVNPILGLGNSATDYNIRIDAGVTYIFSGYFWCAGTVATNVQFKVKWSDGTISTIATSNLPANMTPATAQRLSAALTAPAGVTGAMLLIESSTLTASAGYNVDGIQVERQTGNLTTPSPWNPPSYTYIDAGIVRTGTMLSTQKATMSQVRPIRSSDNNSYMPIAIGFSDPVVVDDPNNRPAWSINANGTAEFGNATFRGNVVVGNAGVPETTYQTKNVTISGAAGQSVITSASGEFEVFDVAQIITVGSDLYVIDEVIDENQVRILGNVITTINNAAATVSVEKRTISSISSNNYVPGTLGWTVRSDGYAEFRQLAADSVDAQALQVGSIQGTHLNSIIDVQSTLAVGDNITINPDSGIVITSPVGNTTFPTDNSGIILAGDVIANSLTVVDNFALRGTSNEIAKGSMITISAGTTAPKSAPQVSTGWKTGTAHDGYNIRGMAKSPRDSRVWISTESLYSGGFFESSMVDIFGNDSQNLNYSYGQGWDSSARTEINNALGGVAVVGQSAYVLCQTKDVIPGTKLNRWYVYKVNYANEKWTYSTRWLYEPPTNSNGSGLGGNSPYKPAIGTKGNNLIIAQSNSAGTVTVNEFTVTGAVAVATRGLRDAAGNWFTAKGDARAILYGNFDFGAARWIYATTNNMIYSISDSSNRIVTNECWTGPGTDLRGLAWDDYTGTFKGRYQKTVSEFSGIAITGAVTYTFGNTWVKSNSSAPRYAANETLVGKTRAVKVNSRNFVTVTTAPIPNVSSDTTSPDATNIYIGPNSTDLYLNAAPRIAFSSAANTVTFKTINYNGVPAPVQESFGKSSNGWIQSSGQNSSDGSPVIVLRGDGSGQIGSYRWDSSGAPTQTGFMQSGRTSIVPSAANTPTQVQVTFPRPFPTVPSIQVSAETSVPGTTVTGVAYLNVTTTGFTIVLTRTNTTTTIVGWLATTPA